MRKIAIILLAGVCGACVVNRATAEQPGRNPGDELPKEKKDYSKSSIVTRMMAFNRKKNGKLTRDEITDGRLLRLFDQADSNKDGIVTKVELMAVAEKLEAEGPQGGRFGIGGPGGPPGARRGGFSHPGRILPAFLQDQLKVTDAQKKELDALQKEVDERLGKILNEDQNGQLKEMRERGPRPRGGPLGAPPAGPPGGRGRPGGE